MSIASKVTREQIENVIKRINEIENARPTQSADEIVASLSELYSGNIDVWVNGKHLSGRAAVNELDRGLFELVNDYHRDIDHLVIDPPFVSLDWCVKSVRFSLEGWGCSILEADEAGLILRSWMYFDPAPFKAIGMQV